MSLTEVMAYADSAGTTLKAARMGVQAAHESYNAATLGTLTPDLRLSATVGYLGDGYGWGRDSSYSFRVEMPHFSTRFGLDAQQVIYAGGALRAGHHKAALGQELAQLGYEQQRQDVHFELVGLYLDLYRAMRQVEVYDSNIALTVRLIDEMRMRHEQGAALQNDRTRYELRLADLQMQRTVVENDMAIANSRIVTLAGLPKGTRVVPDSTFLNVPVNTSLNHYQTFPVQMATKKAEMANEALRQSRAAQLPYIALVAQDQLNGPVTIDITPYDINYNFWFVGAALRYDISSLWKTSANVKAAKLQMQQRNTERQLAEEQTAHQVETALLRIDEARRNYAVKQKSVALAEQNYTVVAARYRADLALMVDLLDAANTKLSAEMDLVGARINIAYRQYLLQYILGIG
ncbi:MAG: TolC family protein [Bacteroidales bacterium]|nr:TolC family protein [Bacteroidales bacterium]